MSTFRTNNKFGIQINRQCNLFAACCAIIHFKIATGKRIRNIIQPQSISDFIFGSQHNFCVTLKRNIDVFIITHDLSLDIIHTHTKGVFFCVNITKVTWNKTRQKTCSVSDMGDILDNTIWKRAVDMLYFNNIEGMKNQVRVSPECKIVNGGRALFGSNHPSN